jgi:hypothetical protein
MITKFYFNLHNYGGFIKINKNNYSVLISFRSKKIIFNNINNKSIAEDICSFVSNNYQTFNDCEEINHLVSELILTY